METSQLTLLLMDYLIKTGCADTASAFARSLRADVDGDMAMDTLEFEHPAFDSLGARKQIFSQISQGKIQDAMNECHESFPGCLDRSLDVLFELKVQQFIELVRDHKASEALTFAQTGIIHYNN